MPAGSCALRCLSQSRASVPEAGRAADAVTGVSGSLCSGLGAVGQRGPALTGIDLNWAAHIDLFLRTRAREETVSFVSLEAFVLHNELCGGRVQQQAELGERGEPGEGEPPGKATGRALS